MAFAVHKQIPYILVEEEGEHILVLVRNWRLVVVVVEHN